MRFLVVAISLLLPTLVTGQPLAITAPAAPGGGWDQTARAMQRVLAQIEPGVSVQVDNVPGAAGTIGLARFIQSERGNPGALMVTGLVMVSGVIMNGSPVSLADTTPIARLIGEYEVIVVPASSPFRSLNDLLEAFKKNPGSVSWGGGSAGGTDDLLVRLLAEQIGLPASSVNYIAFSGGGAALAAVLGGQLSAAVSGYAEFAGQIAAGELRVLAISSALRVSGIDAPTLRESGIALDLANWRAIVAPPGLSAAEQEALTARITRVATSAEWRAALAQNGWDDQFLTGPALKQFLLAEQSRIEDVLRRLSATNSASPTRLALTLTPSSLPNAIAICFAGVWILTMMSLAGATLPVRFQGLRMTGAIIGALLILPVVFVSLGFVASSTLLFAIAATTLRARPFSVRSVAADLIVGAAFSLALFLLFTRGLGVALPGFP
ncbi:MAG: tripartite tricarboxylate transporter TctB family protein [Cyanobacteria bacterium]|nr:tripartite tricarboxylate transporter TctB family protein [Cyanobacteriota bacterium]